MQRNRIAHRRERHGALRQQLRDDGLDGRAGKRGFAGEHLVRDRTKRIQIRVKIHPFLAHRLLGAHVLRRAERQSGLRHARAARVLHGEGDAKIGEQRVPALQQDVLRLDVAMHDTQAVRIAERVGHFTGDPQRLVDRELRVTRQAISQCFTRDKRHHVEQQSLHFTAVQQRENMRVLQSRRGFDFGDETPGAKRGTEIFVQHLDRHLAFVSQIERLEHGGHAASTGFAIDAISVGERRGESLAKIHAHTLQLNRWGPRSDALTRRGGAPAGCQFPECPIYGVGAGLVTTGLALDLPHAAGVPAAAYPCYPPISSSRGFTIEL